MRKFLIILLFPLSAYSQILPSQFGFNKPQPPGSFFNPKDTSGLLLWVYSDTLGLADNDPVSTWTDLSGNGNDAIQAGSLRPLYKTNIQNGRAVLRFDGTDDFMDIANTSIIGGNTGLTVFVVVKQSTPAAIKAILCKWDYQTQGTFAIQTAPVDNDEVMMYVADGCSSDGSQSQVSTDANLGSNFYVLTYVYDGTQGTNSDRVKIYRNGTLLSITTNGTIATALTSCSATLKIGSFGGTLSRNGNFDIAEIAMYGHTLTTTGQTTVENYLKAHWGL